MNEITSSRLKIDSPESNPTFSFFCQGDTLVLPVAVISSDSPRQTFSGKLSIHSSVCNHQGIHLELTGRLESNHSFDASHIIYSDTHSVSQIGTLQGETTIPYEFPNKVTIESYYGNTFRIRYTLAAYIYIDNQKITLDQKEICIFITGEQFVICMCVSFSLEIPEKGEFQVMLNKPSYSTTSSISASLRLVNVPELTSFRLSLKKFESLKCNGEYIKDVEHIGNFEIIEDSEGNEQWVLDLSSLKLSPSLRDEIGTFEVGYEVCIESKINTERLSAVQTISLFRNSYN